MRIEAGAAIKGKEHICPGCRESVTLAQGRIRRPYFAHRPGSLCRYAAGETKEHQQAKEDLTAAFRARGLSSAVEVEVLSLEGDRRADVLVHTPNGKSSIAFEVQHSTLDFEALEVRTRAYIAAGIAVIWVPILDQRRLADPSRIEGTDIVYISHYAAPAWQRWMHDYQGHLWFYEPIGRKLWRGILRDCMLYKNESSWFQDGEERSAGGNWYASDRWRSLFLEGPVDLADIRLRRFRRAERKRGNYILPAGVGADLMIAGEAKDYKVPVRLERIDIRQGHGPGYCIWEVQHEAADHPWRAARLSPFSFV